MLIYKRSLSIVASGAALLLAGCITHEETVYNDVSRVPVTFENDAAARIFYETLQDFQCGKTGTESKTEVSLPIIFDHKRRVVSGGNAAFNEAVARCDTNKDGKITEAEARIFQENKRK
jgi:hypothetical protein